jgi:hypothetical protein
MPRATLLTREREMERRGRRTHASWWSSERVDDEERDEESSVHYA